MNLNQYKSLEKKRSKQNHKDWVSTVFRVSKKINLKYSKEMLNKKSDKELYDLYHSIQEKIRRNKK